MSDLAGKVMKLGVEIHTSDVNELCTFGVHTGHRDDDADVNVCLNVLETFRSAVASILTAHTFTAAVAYEWADGPGFIGWHQRIRRTETATGGSGSKLPAQIAAVIGYRTDDSLFSSVAIGRKRNRFYLGPLSQSSIDADGLFGATFITNMKSATKDLHDGLVGAGGNADVLLVNGLTVVSETQDAYFPADILSMGQVPDTMRSRRQLEPESPSTTALIPG